jgi:hypothetical protein
VIIDFHTLKCVIWKHLSSVGFMFLGELFKQNKNKAIDIVEQELPTLPEHMSSPPVFSGVCVTRSLDVCVYFVDRCLSCHFSFSHCVFCRSSNYDSDYPFGIFKVFILLKSSNFGSNEHCMIIETIL